MHSHAHAHGGFASSVAAKRLARMQQRLVASPSEHYVFLQMAATGHINPVLPLMSAMRARGYMVTIFVAPQIEDYLVASIKATGASLITYRENSRLLQSEPLLAGDAQRQQVVAQECRWTDALLEDLRALRPAPRLLLYDPFITIACAVGVLANVPTMGLVPHGGPGWLAPSETPEVIQQLEGPRQWFHRQHGLDLLEYGRPPLSWFHNSTRCNLVLTCSELFSPPSAVNEQQARLTGVAFHCVGSMASHETQRPAAAEFAMERVLTARDAGARIVLLSLGTLVTSAFWGAPKPQNPRAVHAPTSGPPLDADGALADERAATGGMVGRDFAHFVWAAAIGALGDDPSILVILVTGKHPDATDGLPPLPRNFVCAPCVPQLKLLPLCAAFITHGGVGSITEAVLFRCPMAIVPVFADQPRNAVAVERAGFGVSFRDPKRTVTPQSLGIAIRRLIEPGVQNPYRAALEEAAGRMQSEGGVSRALDLISSRGVPRSRA